MAWKPLSDSIGVEERRLKGLPVLVRELGY